MSGPAPTDSDNQRILQSLLPTQHGGVRRRAWREPDQRWGAIRLLSFLALAGVNDRVAMIRSVDRLQPLSDRINLRRFDVVLGLVVVVLGGITAVLLLDPSLNFVLYDRTLDVALSSLTTLAAAGLAALAMLRYRESARVSVLLQASGFVTLAILSGITVLLVLLRLDGRAGLTVGLPEQLPLYAFSATWLTAAGIFVASGLSALHGSRGRTAHAWWLVTAPAVVLLTLMLLVYPVRSRLPALISDDGIKLLVADPGAPIPLSEITPLAFGLALTTALLFIVGALIYRTVYRRHGPVADGFLCVALVIAAFAELQLSSFPAVYTGRVTTGYFLRLLAYGVLLLGIYSEQRADLRALRAANAALDRMRVTEIERAALEERARVAREIHDGLAQQLWFAKLKFDRLAPQVPSEAGSLSEEVSQALDAAIIEARQATLTMRASVDQDLPLGDMIQRQVDDFVQRSGLRAELQAAPELPAAIQPRHQVELLRILQEALTNVRRHADATVVRIRADVVDRALVLTVVDNGRGFDPGTAREDGLGLLGMEERARLIGGQLRVISAPSDGTQVQLTLPLIMATPLPGPDERVELDTSGTVPATTTSGAAPAPPAGAQSPLR
jgi:signal transduction histidine kinase